MKKTEILSLVAVLLVVVLLSVFGFVGFPMGSYELVPAVRSLELNYTLDGGNYVIYELVLPETSETPEQAEEPEAEESEEPADGSVLRDPGVLTDETVAETEEEVGEILGITDQDVISAVMVMQYRLYNFGISPYSISLEGSGRIRGEFSDTQSFDQIVELLGARGYYEFKDPSGKVLFGSEHIASANAAYYTDSNGEERPLVNFTLDAEAARIFADSTALNAGGQYTITLDGEIISQPYVDRQMTSGTVSVSGFKDLDEAQMYALLQVSGQMPLDLKVVSSGTIDSTMPASALTGAAVGFVLALAVLVLFEKKMGLVTAVSSFAYVSLALIILVGFHYIVTLEGVIGLLGGFAAFVALNLIQKKTVAEEVPAARNLKSAWRIASRKAHLRVLELSVAVAAVSVVFYYMGNNVLCGFGFTLGIGLAAALIAFYAISRTMMLILAYSRKYQDDPSIFGVKKEGEAA